jgi:thiol-disulfide isomerase/thioredoxin
MPPPADPARPQRLALLSARSGITVAALVIVLSALLFRDAITQRVTAWALLANDAPSAETFRDYLRNAADPNQAILAAWNTGKIVHRQIVIRELASRSPKGPPLPPELENILLAGALDPDLNVREAALGSLRFRRHPLSTTLAAAQLHDVDPQVRLLGLSHLKPAPADQALPLVAAIVQDPDLRVAGTAIKLIENWAHEDFDVKLSDTVAVKNLETGVKDFRPEAVAKVQAAVERASAWWSQHRSDYAEVQHRLPPTLRDALIPLPAGEFNLSTLEGRKIRLSDFRGKVVLVNFWTTWCTACLIEIPALIELQERHGDRLAILGISLDYVPDTHGHIGGHGSPDLESKDHDHEELAGHDHDHDHDHAEAREPTLNEIRAKVARTAKRMRINYPVLLDENNVVGGRFRGGELPTTLIIDGDGNIRRRFLGARTLNVFEAMVSEVAGAAGERHP